MHRKTWVIVAVVVIAVLGAATYYALGPGGLFEETLETTNGKIETIDLVTMTFEIKTDGRVVKFRTSEDTVFQLDGREVGMKEALSPGRRARVQHKDGLAATVKVTS